MKPRTADGEKLRPRRGRSASGACGSAGWCHCQPIRRQFGEAGLKRRDASENGLKNDYKLIK